MDQSDFDRAVVEFNTTMRHVANWKQIYSGAAYSTRLRSAIKDARIACERMERVLEE